MAIRNRDTLKNSFKNGRRPTEKDFENLIDSTINILDDGLSKNPKSGIELAPAIGEKRTIMSIFCEPGNPVPEWEVSVGNEGELKICKYGAEKSFPFLSFRTDGCVEIGGKDSNIILNGLVFASGRKGTFGQGCVPANGEWHDISDDLEGVCALEIVAASGRRKTGKYAILIAMATHCFGNKPRIKKIRSHYGIWGNRLKIRWKKNGLKCRLQMKTIFDYGDNIQIHYQISRLWDNPLMENI